jgi:type IV pilus assembly protein PilM
MADNPLSKIFSEGLSFFKKDEVKSVVGIDIGSSSIKVVQLKKKRGKAILETYGALSLGPYGKQEVGQVTNLPVEVISQALTDVLKESNVTTNSGAIAIPSLASLISLILLPAGVNKKNIDQIIPTEARKYIPVPITEVTLDWWMIPEQAESFENNEEGTDTAHEAKTEVLVVAIHNDTLSKYREILTKTNLNSSFFEIEIFSSIRSTFAHEIAPVLLVDFGASKTKLSIVEYGIVKVFHVVNRGSQDITKNIAQSLSISFVEAEKLKREVGLDRTINDEVANIVELSFNYIFSEINVVVLNHEKKYNKNISKVILSGGGGLTRGLLESATDNFKSEVIYGNPFGKTEAPAFLGSVLDISGPEFAVAVGLALRSLQ